MSCPKAIEEAVEGLYAAFSQYPLPTNTYPCGGCHSPGADDMLHAAPLRQLEWKHLADYATDALLVWGDLDCFKHFLPRIFELLLTASDWRRGTPTPEMVFARFKYGEWRTWPESEQAAVEKMLQAMWETILSNPPIESGYIDVDQWLCCISYCENSLTAYLDRWLKDERLSSAWALSSWILGSEIAYTGAHSDPPVWEDETSLPEIQAWFDQPHRGAFWNGCAEQYAQLQRWIRLPEVITKLQRAQLTCGNPDMEREFETAQLCLSGARSMKFERVYKKRLYQSAYWDSPSYRLY